MAKRLDVVNRSLFRYHPVIGYTFIPDLRARVEHETGGYLVRTNSSGFRCNHEFEPKKRPGTSRILLFGDSYTAGDGVSNKYRYGDVLETMLPNVEVYNFALSGSGTDQQYLIYREIAAGIEHDLVIIAVFVENIRRVAARYRLYLSQNGDEIVLAKPYFSLDGDGGLELHQVPVPEHPVDRESLPPADRNQIYGGDRLQNLRFLGVRKVVNQVLGPEGKERVQRLTRYQPLPAYDRPDHPEWRLMNAILQQWVADDGGPVILCPIPTHFHIDGTSPARTYQQRFRELLDPPRVVVHDPLPAFLRVDRAGRRKFRFEQDYHFSPAGHGVMAESLATTVRTMIPAAAH